MTKDDQTRVMIVFAIGDLRRKSQVQWRRAMRDNPMPASVCLNCGKVRDGAQDAIGDHRPAIGNLCICVDCQHLMAMGDDWKLRPLTDAEVIATAGDKHVIRVMNGIGAYAKDREKKRNKRRRYRG